MAKTSKSKPTMSKAATPAPFGDGLKYPFNAFGRLFNFYWILIPILGFFAVMGYSLTILTELVSGKTKELPAFGGFGDNLKQGFLLFIYMIPLVVLISVIGGALAALFMPLYVIFVLLLVLVTPLLVLRYAMKREFASLYQFKWALNLLFSDFGDYIIAYLKTLAFTVILAVASVLVITLIVTVPAQSLGRMYYLADFYRRHQK